MLIKIKITVINTTIFKQKRKNNKLIVKKEDPRRLALKLIRAEFKDFKEELKAPRIGGAGHC